MGKVMVLLALLFSLVCVTGAQGDTLVLRRADGNIYEMNAEVKYYIDGKFSVRLSAEEIRVFSGNQVKEISFGSAMETSKQRKKEIESLKKAVKGEPKTTTLRAESAHFKSLLEMINEIFEVNSKIIYSPDAYDSLHLPPEWIKGRVTIYRENASFEDLLEAIFSQTDFKYELLNNSTIKVSLKKE